MEWWVGEEPCKAAGLSIAESLCLLTPVPEMINFCFERDEIRKVLPAREEPIS